MRCDGALVVEKARGWLGTRYQRQGKVKGLGADCAGFIAEALREAGAQVETGPGAVASIFRTAEYVATLDEAEAGDVIVMRDRLRAVRGKPEHVGIMTGRRGAQGCPYIIHAEREMVVEHRIDLSYAVRIHSIWRPTRCETK